ncbi:DUF1353 domain-containing protein [Novosphingobium aquae]|uniref:DUF1353 domain-containing protein n=1 Tax=Novosphingobium aquae TaxID=3133435 RepID=A0ABU8S3Z6_9SPHN
MSSFTAQLILVAEPEERGGRGVFRVHQAFTYEVGHLGSGDVVTVPAGFRTDLCSIPAIARPFVPIAGRMAKPGLIHDWLLEIGDPRAHDIFDEALGVAGVPRFTRTAMVLAVCLWARWREFRKLRPDPAPLSAP